MNEWIGDLAHLSPMSQKHIVATLCLILGKQFGRKKITYMTVREEQEEAVCYTPHPILQALSIREGGMHGFRHGRVSFLVENNTPVEVIKAWIGHGSERMVRRYTHLRPQYRSRVLASIPSLVGSKVAVIDPLTLEAVA